MKIKKLEVGVMSTNCYIIIDEETNEAAVIDPGAEFEKIAMSLAEEQVNLICIFITHGHFDHILAADELRKLYNIPIACSEEAVEYFKNSELNLGFVENYDISIEPDDILYDGDSVHIGKFDVKAIAIPGHANGSLCYYIESESVVFTGDTLFREDIGNTDIDVNGDYNLLVSGIKEKLLTLPYETVVYPGHGTNTTIEHEKMNNKNFMES